MRDSEEEARKTGGETEAIATVVEGIRNTERPCVGLGKERERKQKEATVIVNLECQLDES